MNDNLYHWLSWCCDNVCDLVHHTHNVPAADIAGALRDLADSWQAHADQEEKPRLYQPPPPEAPPPQGGAAKPPA